MKVLIIRHAIAVERGTPGIADDDRPLTPEGRARFEKAARGLARIAPAPDAILTSPLPRARETAEIAARAFDCAPPRASDALIEARPDAVARLLAAQRDARLVALVGHEPSLSELIAIWLGARSGERFALRKGAAVLLEPLDPARPSPRHGAKLIWALPPRVLRALA
jgi:phosphohistidine phosphatase